MIFANVKKKSLKRVYNFTYKHFSVIGFLYSKVIKAEDKVIWDKQILKWEDYTK